MGLLKRFFLKVDLNAGHQVDSVDLSVEGTFGRTVTTVFSAISCYMIDVK